MRMNPPKFSSTKVEEDPQEFMDEMEKIFKIMHIDEVELAAYNLKEFANQWYNEWEDSKGESGEPTIWGEFVEAFLHRFFHLMLREAKAKEFINPMQGKMSLKEYTLKFNQLACYALEMVGNMRAQMRKFSSSLSYNLVLECKGAMLNRDMDFYRLSVHMQ